MKSMTGFGRGEAGNRALRCAVELSSVNRKQSDIDVRLPRELASLEPEVRRLVSPALSRGRLQVGITVEADRSSATTLTVDHALARQYAAALAKMDRELCGGSGAPPAVASLLRAPGVFTLTESAPAPPDQAWPVIAAALDKALAAWERARSREGAHLRKDLTARLTTLQRLAASIRREAPRVPRLHREALMKRLEEAGLPVALDDERLIREIALFADRADISEELARLEGHFTEFRRLLALTEPSGRSMDFLCQELHREFNTIGSKAGHAGIAHSVVAAKTEVERIREQVQNVE